MKDVKPPEEDRREIPRQRLAGAVKVTFSVEFQGDILDISKEGLAIKFHPLSSQSLNVGRPLRVHVDMGDKIVSMQGTIRRIDEKYGYVVLGLNYNRDEIALFSFPDEE